MARTMLSLLLVALCAATEAQQAKTARGSTSQDVGSLDRKISELEATDAKWSAPSTNWAEAAKTLEFNPRLANEVADALEQDIPLAVVRLGAIISESENGPNAKQKEWLEAQLTALTPAALTVLQQAFDNAYSVLDLRGMLIANLVSNRIKKDVIPNSEDRIVETKKRVLAGASARFYWRLTDVKSGALGRLYSEHILNGSGQVSASAQTGYHLVQVSADVQNTSAGSDAPYFVASFDGLKAFMQRTFSKTFMKEALTGPHRWLDDSLVFLVTPSEELIKTGLVTQFSGLRQFDMPIEGAGIITCPQPVQSRGHLVFVGIFSVPEQTNDFRLLVMGAPPVPIRLAPVAQPNR